MKLFAIADLHLSEASGKPMDVFGARWANHADRLEQNWRRAVGDDDLVLVAGDISWGLSLDEAVPDLRRLDGWPGTKVLLRGNHDYWWTTRRKLRRRFDEEGLSTLRLLRNDALVVGPYLIGGTRGWLLPEDDGFTAADAKILERERQRLTLSLDAMTDAQRRAEGRLTPVLLTHYPPLTPTGGASVLSDLIGASGIGTCLFGHIHHHVPYYRSRPERDGVRYVLTAADQLDFTPLLIGEDGALAAEVRPDGATEQRTQRWPEA